MKKVFILLSILFSSCAHNDKSGAETAEKVNKTFVANKNKFENCYEKETKKGYKTEGDVVLGFDIKPDGSVSNSEVYTNQLSDQIGECLLGILNSLKFERPKGKDTIQIKKPFTFRYSK